MMQFGLLLKHENAVQFKDTSVIISEPEQFLCVWIDWGYCSVFDIAFMHNDTPSHELLQV